MDSSSLSFRKEVLDYLRSCESLLTALSEPQAARFSNDELEVLGYSMAELQKVIEVCNSMSFPQALLPF
jgi:hypothetical protein